MPLAQLIQFVPINEQRVQLVCPCVLLKDGNKWCVLDPENNNELIKGATTDFIRNEIFKGRLKVDAGWDAFEPTKAPDEQA